MKGKLFILITLLSIAFLFTTNFSQTHKTPPGVVIDHISKNEGIYFGGPNIVILADGSYVACCCEFGPKANVRQSPANRVFRSTDKGKTWTQIAAVKPCFESSLLLHNGDLYLLGTDVLYGKMCIRKSTDKGYTWTTPTNETNGVLLEGNYITTSTPWAIYNGRIWHDISLVLKNLNRYPWEDIEPAMLSAAVDADLLSASNWQLTNPLPVDTTYLGGKFLGWTEGNAIATPDGKLVDILRVRLFEGDEYAAMAAVNNEKSMIFNPEAGFVKFQGGDKKFVIRYDKKSNRYWSLVNYIMPEYRHLFPSGVRNAQALCSSKDLHEWTYHKVVLFHPDVAEDGINLGSKTGHHGFQYVDWQVEGDDIIFVSRTAFDDETGGANSYHDANYFTFHRIKKFRNLAKETIKENHILPPENNSGVPANTGEAHKIHEIN
jgi:hypothetical protein